MGQVRPEIVGTLAVWIELFLYGVYTTLFSPEIVVLWQQARSRARNPTLLTYLWMTIAMYIVATTHIVMALFRFLRAYILVIEDLGGEFYMSDFTRWDGITDNVLFCIMTWLGDALVIYRCYYVWNRKLWIIVIPLALLVASIVLNIILFAWWSHGPVSTVIPGDRYSTLPPGILVAIFPIGVAQNVITTGLISLKIWNQHRVSVSHGIVDLNSRLSLIRILRIVIESAMIYTGQSIILMVLHFYNNNFQFMLQHAIVPSIGIVFVLISYRVNKARSSESADGRNDSTPVWLRDDDSIIEFTTNRTSGLPGTIVSLQVMSNDGGRPMGGSTADAKPTANTVLSYNLKHIKSRTDSDTL